MKLLVRCELGVVIIRVKRRVSILLVNIIFCGVLGTIKYVLKREEKLVDNYINI